jgi:hypothetical protein
MNFILPLQQTYKLVNPDGTYTPEFKRYLDLLLTRVGGLTGGVYVGLSNGTIVWDLNAAPTAHVTLANGVNTMGTPTNLIAGGLYRITVIQPSAGAAGTINWPDPPFIFPGGVTPVLSLANNAIDEIWFSSDGTNIKECVFAKNFS